MRHGTYSIVAFDPASGEHGAAVHRTGSPSARCVSGPHGLDRLAAGAGLAQAHAGDLERGMVAVRRAIEIHPGWRTLLERLSPDFAPAGERVRRELDST